MKLLGKVFLLLFLTAQFIYSTDYYLDSKNGSDTNSGLTPSNAWKTISKINENKFNPGDKILFKSGLEWRGQLQVSSTGTANAPIVINSYGEGNKPIIKGSNLAENWKKYSNTVWQLEFAQNPGCIWLVDEDETIHWGLEKESIDSLTKNYDFVWQDSLLYLCLDANLSGIFPQVECSIRDFGIITGWYGDGKDFIIIDNIEIMFTINSNIRAVGSKGWTIQNCILHHSGNTNESDGQGIQYEGEDGIFRNNIIYENGQHGFFLSSFGNADVNNNIIEKNTIYNNYHTSIDLMNDGGSKNSHKNTIIRQNLVYDTPNFKGFEVGIQTLGYGNGLVTNVKIHHNIIAFINGAGISVVPNSDSIFIHNNTVYETKSSCINLDNHQYYAEAYNNIGINHIYYAPFFVHNSKNKNADNNIWNTDQVSFVFVDGEYPETWEQYTSKYNFDKEGSSKDLNIQMEDLIPKIQHADSLSVNNGKDFGYKFDFYGNAIGDKTDIGAVENKI